MENEQPKRPIYKKWWFWVIVVVVFYAVGSSSSKPQNINNKPLQAAETQDAGNIAPIAATSAPEANNNPTTGDAIKAQKELDDVIKLAKTAGLVKSYEFSQTATVVYVGKVWYTQTVQFKKDFIAKIAMLKKTIIGYQHFEVRDAYSNEKVAEVTAFGGSLEVYK